MTENLVRAERTPLDAREVFDALGDRWRATVASEATRPRVLVLVAHVWHETGAGTCSYGWNLAGIKWVPRCGRDFYQVRTNEVVEGKDGKPTTVTVTGNFRSYADLADAISDYLALIRGQFGFAWPAVEACDPRDFAHRLRARGYYTAPEQVYADALVARYRQVSGLIAEDTSPETPGAIANGRPAYVPPSDPPGPPDEPEADA